MIACMTLLLACQLAGEIFVRLSHLPIPGPLVGMALLFVPAGVGIMMHLDLIESGWLPIGVALLASTALTIAATGLIMQRLAKDDA